MILGVFLILRSFCAFYHSFFERVLREFERVFDFTLVLCVLSFIFLSVFCVNLSGFLILRSFCAFYHSFF